MATVPCDRRRRNRDSSSGYLPSRLRGEVIRPNQPGFRWQLGRPSRAVKDPCQLTRVFAFAVEGAADRSEGLGEREDVARDKQIGILRADRMPVDTIGCNGNFRHQIGAANGDTFAGRATQRNPADYSVFWRNLLLIEEVTERLS